MSKKLKNYPDPMEVVNKYGADCVRLFLVNSPVVRADNLRFREEGVREILTNVILKWINSLNFYLGQVELFEQTTGDKFVYDHDAKKSTNVMDRWILATCQTLIQHVETEMAAYRLYTVIPKLLDLISDLTNWYIRFNRTRLKGSGGIEDTRAALNTLYEALLTLCLTMVSKFTVLWKNSKMPNTTPSSLRSLHSHVRLFTKLSVLPHRLLRIPLRTCDLSTFCPSLKLEPSISILPLSDRCRGCVP